MTDSIRGGSRSNAGRKPGTKPLKLARLTPEAATQLAEITAYQQTLRGSVSQEKVLAELIAMRHQEMLAAME